jgi:hypothetical protein
VASGILRDKEFDLAPHRARLVRMLGNPFTRVDTLRVLAARDVALNEATRSRIRAWSSSRDGALACAAALVMDDDRVIGQRWHEVQLEFRCQIIDQVLRRRPQSPLAARLRAKALLSPYEDEREAVYTALESDEHCAAHWDALLTRIGSGGSEVAGESWADLTDRIGSLAEADAADATTIVTRHLNAWCDRDRLPNLSWHEDSPYAWEFEDWRSDPAFSAALDRCILRSDAPATRLIFALIRVANTGGKLPPPVAAEVTALFAASPMPGVPAAQEIHKAAARCAFVPPDTLVDLIRRRVDASARGRRRLLYIRDWIGEGPGRKTAARALVPELLERDSEAHVAAALEILSETRSASAVELDRLRELRSRAMPTWRQRIDRCIGRLE